MPPYMAEDNLGARHRRLNANSNERKESLPTNPKDFEEELKKLTFTENSRRKREIVTQLRDPNSCKLFYEHYAPENLNYALKFLPNCSEDFIKEKFQDVSKLLSPQWLKMLCEKCPEIAKFFYDSFENDNEILNMYYLKQQKYYDKLRFLLKVNGELFLDITEKYFVRNSFKKFSGDATKYIMKNFRGRFDRKPELYTAWLLDIKTVAKILSKDEIKDLVVKLAKAEYLEIDFTYKFVEEFIKALPFNERADFKKQIFVDKLYGDSIEKWPYSPPDRPALRITGRNIFQDKFLDPIYYDPARNRNLFQAQLKKRKQVGGGYMRGMGGEQYQYYCSAGLEINMKTPLDKLFNQYRFQNFDKVYQEFTKTIVKQSLDGRQNMLLVLISKSGGEEGNVNKLLKYVCERHINEPEHFRATVIRSLVKRCSIWRLSSETWSLFLRFAANIGLDGSESNVPCNEGIHAVILRDLLTLDNLEISPLLWQKYLKTFSSFKEYSLTASEKHVVINKLPKLLLDHAKGTNDISTFEMFLNTLNDYEVNSNKEYNELIADIVRSIPNNETLLKDLYRRKIARKELFYEYFSLIQTQDCYLNALKHDPSVLESGKHFEKLIKSDKLNHDRFFRKLAKYYNEPNGLAEKYLNILLKNVEKSLRKDFARPIAILAGDKIINLIENFDSFPLNTDEKRFASALKANMHLSITNRDIENMDWKTIGAKAVANQIMNCSLENVPVNLEKLLSWKKTNRIALALSIRVGKEFEVFSAVAEKHPTLALKTALWYARRENQLDKKLWDVIIPLINKTVSEKSNERLLTLLYRTTHIPDVKKPEYYLTAYEKFKGISIEKSTPILCNIHNIVFDVNPDYVKGIVTEFLTNDFNKDITKKFAAPEPEVQVFYVGSRRDLHFSIIARYLLLCKDETNERKRLEVIDLLFDKIKIAWDMKVNKKFLINILSTILESLRYHKVYLDPQYVSSLPVFEYFVNKMKSIVSIEKYFRLYARVHISMLYYKAVRCSIRNNAEIFGNLTKESAKAAKIVGHIFGVYIGNEIFELQSKYSPHVIKLYHKDLVDYIQTFTFDKSRKIFIAEIIKGILETKQAHILAALLYHSENHNFDNDDKKELETSCKNTKDEEAKFIFYNLSNVTQMLRL